MNLAETIAEITRKHVLENNGLMYAQCLNAIGNLGGTCPTLKLENGYHHPGMVELPVSDSSNGGVVVGAALMGRRPIYGIRYQGFSWYNAVSIVNYAAKSKEIWGQPCPVFVRGIGMEGSIGPVATGAHHSMYMRMSGIPVFAPMTPKEYEYVWNYFLEHDDPVYCSETRRAYKIDYEFEDQLDNKPCTYKGLKTIIAISAARLEAVKAVDILRNKMDHPVNLIHLVDLKPFKLTEAQIAAILLSDTVFVVDSDYKCCGASESIAYEIQRRFDKTTVALGLEDRSAGFSKRLDNLTPDYKQIIKIMTGENYIE